MKIAIDLSQIIYGTGVSHYRKNLVENLLKIDNQNEYLLFGSSFGQYQRLKFEIEKLADNNSLAKTFPLPDLFYRLWANKIRLGKIENFIGDFDILHTSDWTEPPSNHLKVTTIHDLAPFLLPKFTPKLVRDVHKVKVAWSYKESKLIIVPSDNTKQDLIGMGFDSSRIRVVYEAPNIKKAPLAEVERVWKKYNIHTKYVLAIGTNPRKNVDKLIQAFQLADTGRDMKLLVVGESKKVNSYERGVRFLGYLPDEDLSPLLTGSTALLFPSLYEGLGIPILDAFNCGVPVMTSNISAMPEIASDAAILVNPNDVRSIKKGIEDVLSKPKTLIAKGLKRVKDFSWMKTANQTLEIYSEAVKTKKTVF